MDSVQMNYPAVGVVIIGRNEGSRLVTCLDSLAKFTPQVVYVDSASTDNSIAEAKNRGAHVVSLDMTKAFTAARARNAGFDAITSLYPNIKFVQFVDGDCIVNADWITKAIDFLNSNPTVAVVCGRRRELYPQQSVYNNLCDHEWNTPIGEAKACGGDALMRADVLKLVGGYNNLLIAGEEPELCIRIRQAGFVVWRLDAEMTLHDAAITKLSQWWKRTTRAGYAYAEGSSMHGANPERHWVEESRRAWIWGFIIPVTIIVACFFSWKLSILMTLIYPLQVARLAMKNKSPKNWQQAFFLVLGKFAEMMGQFKFLKQKYTNQEISLIEYK